MTVRFLRFCRATAFCTFGGISIVLLKKRANFALRFGEFMY